MPVTKQPEANESERLEFTVADSSKRFYEASTDFKFAAAVASFGMTLRNSKYRGNIGIEKIKAIASESLGDDKSGYRAEFVDLIRRACK